MIEIITVTAFHRSLYCVMLCLNNVFLKFIKLYRLQSLIGMKIPNPPFHFDGLHRHWALDQSDSGIFLCTLDYAVMETTLWPGCHRFAVVQEKYIHWANQQSEIIQELGKINA